MIYDAVLYVNESEKTLKRTCVTNLEFQIIQFKSGTRSITKQECIRIARTIEEFKCVRIIGEKQVKTINFMEKSTPLLIEWQSALTPYF